MISSAAISEAVNLCAINNQRFSAVGERCFSQLETSGLLSQLATDEADELFLSLVAAELEEDADEQIYHRNHEVWALAAWLPLTGDFQSICHNIIWKTH